MSMKEGSYAVGVDVGSVSVNVVVLDAQRRIVEEQYVRHHGQPMAVAARALEEVVNRYGREHLALLATTGAGGQVVAQILGGQSVNEVVAQATATAALYPQVRTIIEIGGEDSKLIFLRPTAAGQAEIADFAMNTMCAAGTGAFLDQQASRLGVTIEEFGALALRSEHPPRVAGRCSVFAKSDMIHLQQQATPVHDIIAGLCYALARNFKSIVGSAAPIEPPVSFQGGVAANAGIVKALREVLELDPDQFIIPEHFAAMGAIGAVLHVLASGPATPPDWRQLPALAAYVAQRASRILPPLRLERSVILRGEVHRPQPAPGEKIPAYLGIDVGSISTNLVVIDQQRRVLAKRYLMTAGRPLEAVRQGLREIGEEIGHLVEIRGVCTTGSGRYLTGDFVGADLVKNEITAQARGALEIDPQVDTIFEIGGQDSKYIALDHGHVVDFEMNKVCAAGTGSFLEEQAERLGISIKEEFADLAFRSQSPADLGERCTVFMETELARHQQAGAPVEDLVAGLAYSIVYNYLNRVVARKRVGQRIFFQGGTAFNRAVVAAFEQVTGKPITVPPHHEVTGALGCAVLALENDRGQGSRFKGFDLADRHYDIKSFECQDCPNHCEINVVTVQGEEPLYYGSRCEKYDVRRRHRPRPDLPDLFREREQFLLHSYEPPELPPDAPRVGLPRAHLFHELYPFWQALFSELGCRLVLSDPTNKAIIHQGAEQSLAEPCFPCKVMLGHVLNLLEKDIDFLFLPSVINLPAFDPNMTDSFVCPYVQSAPYWLRAAIDFEARGVRVLTPVVYLALPLRHRLEAFAEMAATLGASPARLRQALLKAEEAQRRFEEACRARGQEILASLPRDQIAVAVIGRSYNSCDPGANLQAPQKLRNLGVLALPLDFLPLEGVRLRGDWFNMYWRYGQKILAAAEIVADDPRLYPLYITNFGCGPDSFIIRFFQERLGEKPTLIIEIDEHSADVGMVTRCEAFLDSITQVHGRKFGGQKYFRRLTLEPASRRTILIPNMSGHAHVLAAAIQACGMNAEVLPEPDEETAYWGRRYTTGKECFPAIVTTGDMVKRVMQPDFDRHAYAFFMGGSGGPCRFGQYNALQRLVLDELGYEDVPIYAPNQAGDFFKELQVVGHRLVRLAWDGIVAADLLEKALLETRPHELTPGAAEQTYWACLDDLCAVVRSGASLAELVECMERCRQRFAAIPLDRRPKPVIGLVGEFYVRANRFSNQDLIRQLEALGAEVWMSPVYEWFLYRNFRRGLRARQRPGQLRLRLKNALMDLVMQRDERRLVEVWDGFLRNCHEPPTDMVLWYAGPYIHHTFEGEAIMTVGKAVDFALRGLSGVVAVMPFTCMPGNIAHAILKRMRRDHDDIPFLNMAYDGFEQSTARTRLEAFVYQAREYMRTRGRHPAEAHPSPEALSLLETAGE
jgi:predicted CoA-substrate-specific enzyme activase